MKCNYFLFVAAIICPILGQAKPLCPVGQHMDARRRCVDDPPKKKAAEVPTIKEVSKKIVVAQTETRGSLDREIIRRVLRRASPQIKFCYEKELQKDHSLTGKLQTHFKISPSGEVIFSTAKGFSVNVSECVAKAIEGLRFPMVVGGEVVEVFYPYIFQTWETSVSAKQSPVLTPEAATEKVAFDFEDEVVEGEFVRPEGDFILKDQTYDFALDEKEKNPEKAIRRIKLLLTLATKKSPKRPDYLYSLGALQYQSSQELEAKPEEANKALLESVETYQTFLDDYPNDAKRDEALFFVAYQTYRRSKQLRIEAYKLDDKIYELNKNLGRFYWQKEAQSQLNELKKQQEHYQKEADEKLFRSLQTYQELLDNYPNYPKRDQVIFYQARSLSEVSGRYQLESAISEDGGHKEEAAKLKDEAEKYDEDARRYYKLIIDDYPSSAYVPEAFLAFGEFYFYKNDLPSALKAYQSAASSTDPSLKAYALYMQAWCYFNTDKFDEAMKSFSEVLALSRTGKTLTTLGNEARRDVVRTYARFNTPDDAKDFFWEVGGENNYKDMLASLGNFYFLQGQFLDSIDAYEQVIELDPKSDDNYKYQYEVCNSALAFTTQNTLDAKKRILTEMQDLSKMYRDMIARNAPANKIKDAESLTAQILKEVALNWHNEAQKTKDIKKYENAGIMYKEYITTFPNGEDIYTMTWNYAELLFQLGEIGDNSKWVLAAEMYQKVASLDLNGKHYNEAGSAAMISYQNAYRLASGPESKAQPSIKEQDIQERGIECEDLYSASAWIEAVDCYDALLKDFPGHPDTLQITFNLALTTENAKLIDRAISLRKELIADPAFAKTKVGMRSVFALGRLYMNLGLYKEAAESFEKFAESFPEEPDALPALDNASFFREGLAEYEKAIEDNKKFLSIAAKQKINKADIARVSFNIARLREEEGDPKKTQTAYEQYIKDYSKDGSIEALLVSKGWLTSNLWRQGKKTETIKQCRELVSITDEFIAKSPDKDHLQDQLNKGLDVAAECQFYIAEEGYATFDSFQLPSNFDKDKLGKWLENIRKIREETSAQYFKIKNYGSKGWTLAALARIGMMSYKFMDGFYKAPLPNEVEYDYDGDGKAEKIKLQGQLKEQVEEAVRDQLDQMAEPIRADAIKAFSNCIDGANQANWYNEWSSLCEEYLNKISPAEYPLVSEWVTEPNHEATLIAPAMIVTQPQKEKPRK
jgi:tetratricopeptide (TPR) repeat protein